MPTSRKNTRPRQEPHVGSSDAPFVDADAHTANRFAANPGVSAALESKLIAEEVFIRNAQTKKTHAEKRRADADAHFIAGPRTEQTLADAELSRNRAVQSSADADLSLRRAEFVAGPETQKTHADTDLASARTVFVRGVETKKAEWEILQMKFGTVLGAVGGIFILAIFAVVAYVILSALFYHPF